MKARVLLENSWIIVREIDFYNKVIFLDERHVRQEVLLNMPGMRLSDVSKKYWGMRTSYISSEYEQFPIALQLFTLGKNLIIE